MYFGLINVEDEPYVLEYNVRMGDPESEVVIPRINNDILEVFEAITNSNLSEIELDITDNAVSTVMMVSGGYPLKYEKGKEISNLNDFGDDTIVFHAGTKLTENKILTDGGRVLSISSYGKDIFDALKRSYKVADIIKFEGAYFRKDIGFDL